MRRTVLTLGAAALLTAATIAPVFADNTPVTDPALMPAGTYNLDKTHASLLFEISHLGFSHYAGRFDDFDAKLDFKPDNLAASKVEATIQAKSVDTNNAHLAEKLPSDEFFKAGTYPTFTFTSKELTKTGSNTGVMKGELTMLGITKPITMDVTFVGGGVHPFSKKPTIGFHAEGKLTRSEWGITNLVPMVGDEVTFEINAEFNKAD